MTWFVIPRSLALVFMASTLTCFLGVGFADIFTSSYIGFAIAWMLYVWPLCIFSIGLTFALRALRYPLDAWRHGKIVLSCLMVLWFGIWLLFFIAGQIKGESMVMHAGMFHSILGSLFWSLIYPLVSLMGGATIESLVIGVAANVLAMMIGTSLGLRMRHFRDIHLAEIRPYSDRIKSA